MRVLVLHFSFYSDLNFQFARFERSSGGALFLFLIFGFGKRSLVRGDLRGVANP